MKVVSCNPDQMEVSPHTFNACTFSIIDKWDPKQHAKTCDTMFYLRDGTGAYAWDCDKWIFLDFSGYTSSDWNAKQNQQGYIKNKPFEILGNGLTVSENGELSVNISAEDIGAQRKLTAGAGIVIDESDPEKPTISTDGSTYTTPSGTTGVAISDAKVALQGKNMFSFRPPETGDAKAVAIVKNNGGSLNVTQLQPYLTAGEGIKIDETSPKAPKISIDGEYVTKEDLEQAKYESSVNVIYQLIGKEKVRMTFIADFSNKETGSDTNNPHWAGAVHGLNKLPSPLDFKTELVQSRYNSLKTLDGQKVTVSTVAGTSNQYPCLEHKWDIVEMIKRELSEDFFVDRGAIDKVSQVAVAKKIIVSPLESSVWGVGTCPSGNSLKIANYIYSSEWQIDQSVPNTTNTIQKITARNTAAPSIDDEGYLRTIIYTEPSNENIGSQINVDYGNLVFTIEISMNEHIKSMIATYHEENIATQDEVDIGQSLTKIVTPSTLAKYVNDNTVNPEELNQVFQLLTNVRKFTLDTSNSTCIATGSITFERVGYEVHFTGAFRTAKEITANSYIANKGITSLPDWLEAEGTVKNLITYSESDEIFRLSYYSRDLRSGDKVIPNDTWVYIQSGSYIVSESAREL